MVDGGMGCQLYPQALNEYKRAWMSLQEEGIQS